MTARKLAHSLEREARATMRQARPIAESQRRVALELVADLVSGLAIIAALIVVLLASGRFLLLLAELLPWSAIYIAVVLAGILGLCRAAAQGDRS